jgi:DNA-binding NarL/FixJ family response regulator
MILSMTKVLVVDDHPIVRRGIKEILSEELDLEILETADARETATLVKDPALELVVLDLELPGKHGLELLKEIKTTRPKLPILVLSIYPEEQFAVRVLKAGASGFVSKDAASEDLVRAVRKILRGGKHVSDRVAEFLLSEVKNEPVSSPHQKLSDREFQILRLLGLGKTVGSIANDLSLSVATVSTYRARILEKLDMKTTAELVRYAIQSGLTGPQ